MDDKNISIIVIDDSFDTEEKIISNLRNSGFATRSMRVEDEEDLLEAIGDRHPDVIIYTQGMELISLQETCECVRKIPEIAEVPVIAVDRKQNASDVTAVMSQGAADLSTYENMDHLRMIIQRETRAFRNWKNIDALNKALTETETRCSSLLDSSRDAIAYVHEGMHVYSNQSYVELFGFESSDEIESLPILDMVAMQNRDEFKEFLRKYMKGEAGIEAFNTHLVKPDGTEFDGEMEFSPASIEGEPCTQVVIRLKLTNSDELEEQIKLMGQKDATTGTFNRQYGLEKLSEVVSGCAAGTTIASLLEVSIDNFDDIKDMLGVTGADEFITATANMLMENVDEDDIVSRFMYSNFTILTKGKNQAATEEFAEKIQNAMSDLEIQINGENVNTTVCIGIALMDKNTPDQNEILSRAEKATAEAQSQGRNQRSVYIPKAGELTRQETDDLFKKQITEALRFDKFELHFQPIVSLQGDPDHRYEVFVRLGQEASEQLVMPQDFLPTAERVGMATAIDRWVLNKTINVLTERWKAGERIRFFIKLSAASIQDDTLIEWLKFQTKEKGLPPQTIFFEVKESVAVTNLKNTKALAQSLHEIGCGFVMDDFGAGSNPFQILDHIHVDFIRIGQEYMTDILENENNQESVKQIAKKAGELGKMTIAQHVQDVNSLSLLWGMGIHFIQGYVLQEPMPHLEYDFTEMA